MSAAETTTDHDAIRSWIEERGGRPAKVSATSDGEGGVLRVDFGEPEAGLEAIEWDEFFRTFEESKLGFLHQDRTEDGAESRFSKFVSRS